MVVFVTLTVFWVLGSQADDEEAPEFVIDANLAAAQKRGVRCGPKRAAKRVCCAASVIKTSTEIAADIEAGPVIGIGRSDRDVSSGCAQWRRNGRCDICCQRCRTKSNAQRDNTRQPFDNTRQPFHDDSPDLSFPGGARPVASTPGSQAKSSTTRRGSRKPRSHYRQHLNASQCREFLSPLACIDWTFTSCCGN